MDCGGTSARVARDALEVYLPDEHKIAFLVSHHVIAVQTISVLVEIENTFCTFIVLDGQNSLPDRVWFGTCRVFDRNRKNVHGVIGPG